MDGLSAVISTYAPTVRDLVVGYQVGFPAAGRHTIGVKVLGTQVAASRGHAVIIDGLWVLN